jgi:hypothetical protein
MARDKNGDRRKKEEPVSLHPLAPKEALADLMKVKPEKRAEPPSGRPKKKDAHE